MSDRDPDAPPDRWTLGPAWALLLAAVLWHGLHPVSDLDLWWHIRTGEQLMSTGTLLVVDPFSHAFAEAPWPYKDAGFSLLAYGVWSVGGAPAIVIAKAAGFVVMIVLLWRLLRHARSLPPALATVAVALAADGSAYRFTERAASLSLLILVAVLVLIERDRQGRPGLWWAIGLTALNANLHRGAIVVPVVLSVYALTCFGEAMIRYESHAGARYKRNVLIAVAAAAACLATPFTTALLATSSHLMQAHTVVLSEWAPVSLPLVWALTPSSLLIGAAAVLGGLTLVLRVRPLPLWDLALVGMAFALGLASMRHLPYLTLLAIGPVARAVAPWTGWIRRVGGLLAIAVSAAVVASAARSPMAAPALGLAPAHYPERGVAFVQGLPPDARLRGNMFNEFGYGGYLIFHLWPEYRVFVDGRADLVYSAEHTEAAASAPADPQVFAELAARHHVEWVILDNAPHAGARGHLDADSRWTLVHVSRRAAIYVRADGVNRALAAQHGYRWLWVHDLDGSIARAAAAGHGAEAISELQRMVDDDPDNVHAIAALARLGERLGIETN
ncbi:MAG: hypothetical protein AAF721_15565 [Myxococcota bacterium]